MMRNIRAMLTRADFTDQEVRTLRGMIVALSRGKHRHSVPSAPSTGDNGADDIPPGTG
jgi:tRNA C32,U32 (ribose-2'-O)-methylase TrmJ